MRRENFKDFYTPQVDERDCGVAALNMVLKKYGSDYSLSHLRQIAKTSKEGTTALGIVKTANQLGLDTQAVKTDMSIFQRESLQAPFIVHIVRNKKLLHYCTVFCVSEQRIIVGDPDPKIGVTELTYEQFKAEWSGVALFFTPNEHYQPKKEDKKTLTQFIPMILTQRRLLMATLLAAIIVAAISIIGSYFVQEMVDEYIPHEEISLMVIVSVGLVCAYIFQAILHCVQSFFSAVFGQRLKEMVSLNYLKHVFDLPLPFFYTRKIGEITSRFADANNIIEALANTIITIFLNIWIALLVGLFLFLQNAALFIISLTIIPIYALIVIGMKDLFVVINQEVMESDAVLGSTIIESLSGIETIKSLRSEERLYEKAKKEFHSFLLKKINYDKLDYIQQSLKAVVKQVLNLIVLSVGAFLVINKSITVGELFTFTMLLTYFMGPLESIVSLQPKLQQAKVANNRLDEVNTIQSEFAKSRRVKKTDRLDGDIVVNNLNFNYGYGARTLKNVNFRIDKGSKVAIIGMSGSGKTTLAKLLVGFLESDDKDSILINGYDINSIERNALRHHICYVSQDDFVLSETICENLVLGSGKEITLKELRSACKIADLDSYIMTLPMQYDTLLSENGGLLSGGQRQRLAIARAILSPAKVLVFDESTSNLDVLTEQKVLDRLLKLETKTIIFIAHRLNITKKMDRVIALEHGSVAEDGSPSELLAHKGLYSSFLGI